MSTLAFLEGPDLFIVAAVILLLFGGSQLPKLAKSIGQARREFEKAVHDDADHPKDASAPPQAVALAPPTVSTPTAPAPAPAPADEQVVLSRTELDAMLQAKEDEVRQRQGSDQAP